MSTGFRISEETPDRNYFTIIPNYIVNHSTIYEQGIYLVMKRIAGESGKCFASHQSIADRSGTSRPTVSRTIKKLLKRDWLRETGNKIGKTLSTKEYQIVDLWELNSKYYQAEREKQAVNHRTASNTSLPGTGKLSTTEQLSCKPQNSSLLKKIYIKEDNKKNAVPPKGDIVENLLKEGEKSGIQSDWQYLALELIDKLKVPKEKRSECFRIIKNYPRNHVTTAVSFASDYPKPLLKWKMFLWKLNKLVKKVEVDAINK